MLLAIDVGNTHTVLGLFDGKDLVEHWRIATEAHRTADEIAVVLHGLLAQHPGPRGADGESFGRNAKPAARQPAPASGIPASRRWRSRAAGLDAAERRRPAAKSPQ